MSGIAAYWREVGALYVVAATAIGIHNAWDAAVHRPPARIGPAPALKRR